MKRILKFNKTEKGYACFENEVNVFEVSNTDMLFDVKSFYQAFYGDGKEYDDIQLENSIPEDKQGLRIFDCIKTLVEQIKEKLLELSEDDGEQT